MRVEYFSSIQDALPKLSRLGKKAPAFCRKKKIDDLVVGITPTPLSILQKDILARNLPKDILTGGIKLVFDTASISEKWSFDYLINILPVISFYKASDLLSKENRGISLSESTFQMSMKDFWEFALEAEETCEKKIYITEFCNLRCVMCPFHSESDEWCFKKQRIERPDKKHISLEHVGKYFEDATPGRYTLLSGNGEPFLHPKVLDVLKIIKLKKQIVTVQTNGTLITRELLNKLADIKVDYFDVSMEGITSENYKSIRINSDFDSPLRFLKEAMDMKVAGKVDWTLRINFTEVPPFLSKRHEVVSFFQGYADQISFRRAVVDPMTKYTFDQQPDFDADEYPPYCFLLMQGPILSPRGLVFPCCVLNNNEWFHEMPWVESIEEKDLRTILANYKQMLKDKHSPLRLFCSECTFWVHSYKCKNKQTDPYFEIYTYNNE